MCVKYFFGRNKKIPLFGGILSLRVALIHACSTLAISTISLRRQIDSNPFCKIIIEFPTCGTTLKGKKTQLNLNDGSNVLSDKPIQINDTLYLDFQGKITKHVSVEKGKHCMIISGKYIGKNGKIENVENGKVSLKIEGVEKPHSLEKARIFAI